MVRCGRLGFGLVCVTAILLLSTKPAGAEEDKPECWLTTEGGEHKRCTPLNVPQCIWMEWFDACMPIADVDCNDTPPCSVYGDFLIREVNLDGDKKTREFAIRMPQQFHGGTAEHSYVYIEQAVGDKCQTLMVANGLVQIQKARTNGWRRIVETAAIGGPFSYVAVHAWDGRQYSIKEEWEDISHDDAGDVLQDQGPVLVTIDRPSY